MNISGGQSTATPFWQTEDLRFGIVTSDISADRECEVRLSCGDQVRATVPTDIAAPLGAGVRVRRLAQGWCVERVLS